MSRYRSLKIVGAAALLVMILALAVSPTFAATIAVFNGNIASGAQFDLYNVSIEGGMFVTATLVCDFDGVSRPLDPVLSVYFPGSDPSDTINADVYNDDGFGMDDDPGGVDCDAFDSSRVTFLTPSSATYVFRADGFGSSTGPYTLHISASPAGGFNPGDDRINVEAQAAFAIYCRGQQIEIWDIGTDGVGTRVMSVPFAQITDALVRATSSGVNTLITEAAGNQFFASPSNQLYVTGPDVNNPTRVYTFAFPPSRCGITSNLTPFATPIAPTSPPPVYVEIRPGVYILSTQTP
jgi:hypothetical protein